MVSWLLEKKIIPVTLSLWIKPTDALNSNFIDITTLHVSGSISAHHQEFLAVYRLWCILWSCDRLLPGVGWNSWWWAERLPETCRVVIRIKLEFGATLGFIHKEYVYDARPYDRKIHCTCDICFCETDRLISTFRIIHRRIWFETSELLKPYSSKVGLNTMIQSTSTSADWRKG